MKTVLGGDGNAMLTGGSIILDKTADKALAAGVRNGIAGTFGKATNSDCAVACRFGKSSRCRSIDVSGAFGVLSPGATDGYPKA